MNRGELRQFVRDTAVIESTDVTDEILDQYLDEGYLKVVGREQWIFAEAGEHVTADGTYVFEMSTPATSIMDLFTGGQQLRQLSFDRIKTMFEMTPDAGTVSYYAFRQPNHIYVYPILPSGRILDVRFFKALTFPATDTAEPEWEESFHHLLADWCLRRVWEREEDAQLADSYHARFEAGMGEMRAFYGMTTVNEPPAVSTQGGAQ